MTEHPRLLSRVWTFLRIMSARLRFLALMAVVGLLAANWEKLQNYYDRWRRPAVAAATQDSAIEYYCPMHPNIIRDAPGNCPICGMPLAKRPKSAARTLPEGVLAQVELSPQKVQMGRIATSTVEYRLLGREIRTVGFIDYDETRRAFVAARVKGRLDELLVNYVGQHVAKGAPLALIYSPDLLVAQEELLTAARQLRNNSAFADPGIGQSLLDATRRKLVLWGITNEQIDAIIRRGAANTHMTIYSPIEGIVTEKKVLEGHYVNEGDDLYTIADLTHVWMQAKIFEDQIAGVRIGTAVEVSSVAYPNEIFAGRITFIAYTVDPATRTIAARVEIDNPDLKLRPGMYANAIIRLPVGAVTEIPPASAASAPASGPSTDDLATAYLAMTGALAKDAPDAGAIERLRTAALAVARAADEPAKSLASDIAGLAADMASAPLKLQRKLLKSLSQKCIALLGKRPPTSVRLFIAHCPMAVGDWLQTSEKIANPYYGESMLRCGEITGHIEPGGRLDRERYAEGYFCPVYPETLFDQPRECPVDKFPTKFVRIEKILAVPASAVVDTGARKIVYRESAPGTFDMLQVTLGGRAGDLFPVISGLRPGDRVATAGAFLVDAENRLNPAAAAQYLGAAAAPGEGSRTHQHGG